MSQSKVTAGRYVDVVRKGEFNLRAHSRRLLAVLQGTAHKRMLRGILQGLLC
jgi:hypothetical protein